MRPNRLTVDLKKTRNIINIVLQFSIFFIALALLFFPPERSSLGYRTIFLFLGFSSTLLFLFCRKLNSHGWVSISFIFILGYSIVHFQVGVLEIFGFTMPKFTYALMWADESVKNASIAYSVFGLLCFNLSTTIASHMPTNVSSKKHVSYDNTISNLLIIFSYVLYIIFFVTAGSYTSGGYGENDGSTISIFAYKYFNIILTAAIICRLGLISKLKQKKIILLNYLKLLSFPLLALCGWHMLFSLYIGDRGVVIFYAICLSCLYFTRFNKPKFITIIVGIIILSIVLTFVGQVRLLRHSGDTFVDRVGQVSGEEEDKSKWFDTKVPLSGTLELALSGRTLNHALKNVPSIYPHTLGSFQVQRLLAIFPGLSGLYNSYIYNGDKRYDASTNFITFLIQGNNPAYGDGTSITADLYLDFGPSGIFIGMTLLGLFIGLLERRLFKGSFYSTNILWISVIVILSKAIYMSRGTLLSELYVIVNVWLVINILNLIIRHIKNRKY
jgi:hypothetical protein